MVLNSNRIKFSYEETTPFIQLTYVLIRAYDKPALSGGSLFVVRLSPGQTGVAFFKVIVNCFGHSYFIL
jgi:hypothetical protein